ncbi:MAG: hypothetical protein RBT61_07650 [Candidatus Kapabacteria bacterium]|jgi:hypothetical protein|nr:hypothetical protein [Candidatus Kapabacteria bacterium]
MKSMKIFYMAVATIVLLSAHNNIYAQLQSKINFAFGVVTTDILGDNPAKKPMVATNTSQDAVTGGSFKYTQPGLRLKTTYIIEEMPNLRFQGNIDYLFFGGKERVVINSKIVHYLTHDINIASLGFGAEYVWADLDFANAKLYSGINILLSSFHNIGAEIYEDYLELPQFSQTKKLPSKDAALRLGGTVKLIGVEGRLRQNFFVNTGVSIGSLNLIGRDDARGELLTPLALLETGESMVHILQVYISLQYNM